MATSYTSPFTGDIIVPTDVSYNDILLTQQTSSLIWSDAAPRSIVADATFFAARIIDLSSISANLVLRLPAADEGSVGTDMLMRNIGSVPVVIQDFEGNGLITINPGVSQWFYLTNNNSAAGVWRSVTFGAGVSASNAGDLAGGGLRVDEDSQLAVSFPVTQYTTVPDLNDGFSGTVIEWIGTKTALPLPTPSNNGWMIGLRNNGSGEITINPPSGIEIDGEQSVDLLPGESTFIIYNNIGTQSFLTLGRNRQRDFYFSISNWDISGLENNQIDQTGYAAIIQYYFNSDVDTAADTEVFLPLTTNTYYIINNSLRNIILRNGRPEDNPAGNTVQIEANQSTTIVSDGTNMYATNTVPVGTVNIARTTKETPSVAITEEIGGENVRTSGLWANLGVAGITVDRGASYVEVTSNQIILAPGIEGQIAATLDGGLKE